MGTTAVNGNKYPNYEMNNHWGLNVSKIGAINTSQQTGGVVDTTTNSTGFARNKFPTATGFNYHEYLAAGGESNWSLIC